MIELTVKTLDSRNHSFSVADNYTVRQLKEHIADSVNISADSQRLIYCGRLLQDEKTLTEYDVNGKVIHLVQRAPPVNNGSGPDRGSSARTGSGPRRNNPLHNLIPGSPGNAMYLGAMAFPAEIMESHGISVQNPRHCLSQSRLAIVRNMLQRASVILNRLENPPQGSSDTSPENGTQPPDTSTEEEAVSGGTPIAAIEISPLLIDSHTLDIGGPSVDIQTETASEQTTSEQHASEQTVTSSDGDSEPQTPSTSDQQPSQNETEEEEGNSGGSRYPRTQALADLMDQANEINTRVQPFMAQYQQLMRDDPVFSDQDELLANQRLFKSVSEIMHNLAHAYHALSDIMCDLSQPPPRSLRCRPVLIHHSAVVQTGIPIQVSASVANASAGAGQGSNSGSGRTTDSGARAATAPPEAQGAQVDAAEATPAPQPQPAATAAASTPAAGARDETAGQTQPPSSHRTTRIGPSGPGFEIFVDVAPGSITIDSVEATVVTNSNPNTAGDSAWQTPPEFVRNFVSALAGQFMDAALQQYGIPSEQQQQQSAPTTTGAASTTAATTAAATATVTAAAAGTQNSQARVTTATHPTTATQTRSTARPHVHLSPSIHGLRSNTFDPLMPCNSHHIRSEIRLRRQGQRQQGQADGFVHMMSGPREHTMSSPRNLIPEHLIGNPTIRLVRSDAPSRAETNSSRSSGSQQSLPADLQALIQAQLSVPIEGRQIPDLMQVLQLLNRSQNSANLAQLLESVPGYSYTPGESIFTDIFMTLAQSLSFMDLVQLGLGNSECLVRARPQLRQFITQRLLNNEPLSIAAITQVVDRFNNELRPYYAALDSARLRDEVDLPASINFFNHSMLPTILNIVMEEGNQTTFHRNLMKKCALYMRQLCALLQYCCLDGVGGLESILRAFVNQMTNGVPVVLQEWTMNRSIFNFRTFIGSLNVPVEDIRPFLVYRISGPPTSPRPATSAPLLSPPAALEPMDTEDVLEVELDPTPSFIRGEPPVGDVPPAQHVNEVIGWQNALPSEWVPIISRDSQRQRRPSPQVPFSDAYLSGMPSKRRKVITSKKPQGNLSQVITESMATALGAAGVSTGPEVDAISQRAGQDNTLRAAYREQVRTTLRHNLDSLPDYLPDKYPNTAKYLKKQ